jgi:SAM-dependent methyltransferase
MFSASAELYDLIYAGFKDYPAEAELLASAIRAVHPHAHTVLDVACGTGEHARLLTERHGFAVDGLDLDPAFVRIAQAKLPQGTVYEADMTAFALPRRYDVIVCLFSSIGYVRTLDNVRRALTCIRAQLEPEGIALIEPWFKPGDMKTGHIAMKTAQSEELIVCRMSRTEIDGRLSRLHFEYLICRPDRIDRASEVHELGLFTVDEMLACFRDAGLDATFDPVGPYRRGLYLARPTPT